MISTAEAAISARVLNGCLPRLWLAFFVKQSSRARAPGPAKRIGAYNHLVWGPADTRRRSGLATTTATAPATKPLH